MNDIGELFTPNYLVVVDPPVAFSDKRRRQVENTDCPLVSQKETWINREQIRIQLSGRGVDCLASRGIDNKINHSITSPYVACIVAFCLGAKRIGLLGVDFTDNHFNNNDGKHNLTNRLAEIEKDFGNLCDALKMYGCELVNLSESSVLKSMPKTSIEKFLGECV